MTSDPIVFLLKTLANIYLFVVLLRLVLQLTRADFYNPISQGIVKATNPLILPIRKLVPSIGRVDSASVVLALLVQLVTVAVVFLLKGYDASPVQYLIYTVMGTIYHLLDLYFWAMLISVILSWVAPNASHPGALLVFQITEPLYRVVRGFVPNLGGLDISPIFIFLGISFAKQMLSGFGVI